MHVTTGRPEIAALIALGVCFLLTPLVSAEPIQTDPPGHHLDLVMTSRFCADCHPAIYAEHAQNTHGRAFTDEEVRLATGRFSHGDCIRCHTPRPVFETGIGLNPLTRHHNLEEGNTCMSCHWKPDYDYGSFQGNEQCLDAFDDRVGAVEACASCHRNHGTPYQWEVAPTGKLADKTCVDCHMKKTRRPVAIGEEPRLVRTHGFPGARSPSQLKRAYRYEAFLDGNEVVVRVTNRGAGHHFPTELKQRSVESLIVVKDTDGNIVSRSRMIFRDPYKRPYGLTLPVNTQIPPGETREHRVPVRVHAGSVETELHFKLYYPIEDHHPDLARLLESRSLIFDDIVPSEKEVMSDPEVVVTTPESVPVDIASPANLVDFAHPPIGTVEITMPEGDSAKAIQKLIELFQFPVPQANRMAQTRLAEIGAPAIPALVEAMGSWDNKTWKQAMNVLAEIGDPAITAVLNALASDQLYVRVHARALLPRMGWLGNDEVAIATLFEGTALNNAVDRATTATAIGELDLESGILFLLPLLDDNDPDVVRAAALSLASLGSEASLPSIQKALEQAYFPETRLDLAYSMAVLGSADGIGVLLDGLDYEDDLIREDAFEKFFAVTGIHLGYDPYLPHAERLAALAKIQAHWMRRGGNDQLRVPPGSGPRTHHRAWTLVQKLGETPGSDEDIESMDEILFMGEDAVPALLLGLKYPAGFAEKRARICEALGRIGSAEAAPALSQTLRDPVLAVAAWAAWALEYVGDRETLATLARYQDRLQTLAARGQIPAHLGSSDSLIAQCARTQLLIGDGSARNTLVNLLLSDDPTARGIAIDTLEEKYGERRGYEPDAPDPIRRIAAARWAS